jgi:midasin
MAENGCGAFALEATALLCKALSRLEVGELGVVAFGGTSSGSSSGGVTPLQPLEVPFTDAAGPGLMAALRFDQENTIADRPMLQLVEGLDHLLEVAKHRAGGGSGGGSSRGAELRQLVLVLADGRFHEKESLRAAVRRLLEKSGVCVVFIALDAAAAAPGGKGGAAGAGPSGGAAAAGGGGATNAASRAAAGQGSSLLEMQSVKFVGGVPVFERYLDTFPFPYYIVLRDIAALPRTLADLMRQWFELNSVGAA